jgi:hypothetical protein
MFLITITIAIPLVRVARTCGVGYEGNADSKGRKHAALKLLNWEVEAGMVKRQKDRQVGQD